MIVCDNNVQLVVTTDAVRIFRSDSAVKYDIETFENENIDTLRGMVREYEMRLYEYIEDAIISHKINETRDFPVGTIIDFHKIGSEFFFVKNEINRMCLVNGRNIKVLDGFSQYFFDGECMFYMVDEKNELKQFYKHNFKNEENVEVACIKNKIVKFIANNDYLVYTNTNNEIHILPILNRKGEGEVIYHYHSKKIEKLAFFKNYVISVGKDGKVVRFGLEHNEKRLLFLYDGIYVNMKVFFNKIFLLSDSFFKVYDIGIENEVYIEVLPSKANYSIVKYMVPEEEKFDIFKSKKKSIITATAITFSPLFSKNKIKKTDLEIIKTMELTKNTINCEESCVAFINNKLLFLISDHCIISMYKLDTNSNFITGNKLISVKIQKKKLFFFIFNISKDQLILSHELSLPFFIFDSIFYVNNIFYFRNGNNIFTIDPVYGIEKNIFTSCQPVSFFHNITYLLALDTKGIYDIIKEKYILKQSKVYLFCIVDSNILFYIVNQGLYIDKNKQKPLLTLKILDIIYHDGFVKILHIVKETGRILSIYKLNKIELVKISEKNVDLVCSKIINNNFYETIYNQLVFS